MISVFPPGRGGSWAIGMPCIVSSGHAGGGQALAGPQIGSRSAPDMPDPPCCWLRQFIVVITTADVHRSRKGWYADDRFARLVGFLPSESAAGVYPVLIEHCDGSSGDTGRPRSP